MRRIAEVKTRYFTIIEITVVMVIVLVMLGVSMASYRSVTRANRVDMAARELASQLTYARQLAITRRAYVACIMPASAGTGLAPEYQYRAYRLAFVEKTASDYQFIRWIDDSVWNLMPDGLSIMEADDDVGIQDSTTYARNPEDNAITEVNDVNLAERLDGGGSAANVRAIVFSASGQLKGSGRYVTIGRATYNGTNWTVANPAVLPTNVSTSEQMTLEVNRFTGSVRYLTPDQY